MSGINPTRYITPTPPDMLTPIPGSILESAVTEFVWDVGNLNIQKYRFIISSEANGHEVGFVPAPDQSLQVYEEIQGNTREVPYIPQGYNPLYVNLFYTEKGIEYHRQYLYSTKPLGITAPEDGAVVPVGLVQVTWVPSSLGDLYNLKVVLEDDPTVVLYQQAGINNPAWVLPESVPRTGNWVISVEYIVRQFTDSVTVTPALEEEYLFPIPFSGWSKLVETFSYTSIVNTYRNGLENRYGKDITYKHNLSVDVPVTPDLFTSLTQMVNQRGEKPTFVPFWQHELLDIVKDSGTTYAVKDREGVFHKWFSVGQRVILWNSPFDYALTFITERTMDSLTVEESARAYTRVAPIFLCNLNYSSGGTLELNGQIMFSMSFDKIQDKSDHQLSSDCNAGDPTWSKSGTVVYVPGNSTLSFSQVKFTVASPVLTTQTVTGLRAQTSVSYTMSLITAKEIADFSYWFTDRLRGRQNSFIHPISTTPYKVIDIQYSYMDIEPYNAKMSNISNEIVTYLIFEGLGSVKVRNIVLHGAYIRVEYVSAPVVPPTEFNNCTVYLGFKARMASDSVKLDWVSNTQATVSLSILEVLEE